jgi:hypothetical protein
MSTFGDAVAAANSKLQADPKAASSTKAFGKATAAWIKAADPLMFPVPIPPPPVPVPVPPPAPAPPPISGSQVGVYRWGQNPAGVGAFEKWLGKPVPLAEDFCARDWTGIEGPGWLLDPWKGSGRRLVLGVPMFAPGGSLAQGAAGAYDSHFVTLAQNLKSRGLTDTIIRLGWEFGGGWYIWHPTTAQQAGEFAAMFARVADAMRAVCPTLTFCFNGTWDWQPVSPVACYPGDAYVDWIGPDVYDQTWKTPQTPQVMWDDFLNNQYGGKWWADFAKAHGKPLVIPEWGLSTRSDGHGLGDDPYFIDQMADWIQANGVAWHVYFDVGVSDGEHRLSVFPNSAARFKARFGAA